jgi:hypothetical protein
MLLCDCVSIAANVTLSVPAGCFTNTPLLLQLTFLRRLLDDDIMEHLEHITELSDK